MCCYIQAHTPYSPNSKTYRLWSLTFFLWILRRFKCVNLSNKLTGAGNAALWPWRWSPPTQDRSTGNINTTIYINVLKKYIHSTHYNGNHREMCASNVKKWHQLGNFKADMPLNVSLRQPIRYFSDSSQGAPLRRRQTLTGPSAAGFNSPCMTLLASRSEDYFEYPGHDFCLVYSKASLGRFEHHKQILFHYIREKADSATGNMSLNRARDSKIWQ